MASKNEIRAFTSFLEISRNNLWGSHFRVPGKIAAELIERNSRRVLCSINDAPERQCALLPIGNEIYVISVNRELQKKLRLRIGEKFEVRLRKDKSKYGLPMPEEFAELLKQDRDAHRLIHALTPGKLRTLLYIVGRGKTSDQRIEWAVIIVRHLKENKGRINYRQLGEAMKKEKNGGRK
jgi:hypothetical protein